jgi:lipoprotein NlpD
MSLLTLHHFTFKSNTLLKTVLLSTMVISTVLVTGCASKPMISNASRYASAPDFYTVKSGDTLSGIAARYGLSYTSVAQMNDIAEPYVIFVGQSIRLRTKGQRTTNTEAIVQSTGTIERKSIGLPSNTVTSTANKPATTAPTAVSTPSVKTTPAVPSVKAPVVATSTKSRLTWVKPTQAAVLQQFDPSKDVKGTRYAGKLGDPIYAAADGQVVYAADGLKEYGNLVLIKHIDGYITAYAHNSKMMVTSGQNVKAGQKIAEMGSTGTTRVMLEFQVRLDGKPVNPITVLSNS